MCHCVALDPTASSTPPHIGSPQVLSGAGARSRGMCSRLYRIPLAALVVEFERSLCQYTPPSNFRVFCPNRVIEYTIRFASFCTSQIYQNLCGKTAF
jgi:hypothetical protein